MAGKAGDVARLAASAGLASLVSLDLSDNRVDDLMRDHPDAAALDDAMRAARIW